MTTKAQRHTGETDRQITYDDITRAIMILHALTYLLRSSSPCQDNGQQEFAICACL